MEAFDDEQETASDFTTREEQAAAAEAAAIGGPPSDLGGALDEEIDEADRAVYEAGGGEAEGFELAERDLVRNASHGDGEGLPERDAFTPERESDRAGVEYGQPDEESHTDH